MTITNASTTADCPFRYARTSNPFNLSYGATMKIKRILGTISFFAISCLAIFVFSSAVVAQTGQSSVRGVVNDPQGRPVAGATVTLTNDEKNFSRTQTTTENGSYLFTAVPPGSYNVTVESRGFKKATVTDVKALVETPTDA